VSDTRAAIRLIAGVEPTPEQVRRVQAIAHSLDIPASDAMMPILIMLDTYHGAFSALPQKALNAAKAAAENATAQSTLAINTAVAQAVKDLGPEVGAAVVKVASDINHVNKAKWIGGVVLGVALLLTAFGRFTHQAGYSSGFETGRAAGYKAAADEKAMAAWANTDQGRLAYELAQAGNLEKLAHCDGKGWELEKGMCYPFSVMENQKNMTYGWSVGKSAKGAPARKTNVSWFDYLFGSAA